ncbi:MAG: hypothetical protein HY447_04340 [Candidatus Omnitrophica bacterium]|nr:hypothetical protein [Candidatus Omnitrophota bacterium]
MQVFARRLILSLFLLALPISLFAQEPSSTESPADFLFRDQFYLSPSQKIRHNTYQADDFLLVQQASPDWNSDVAIVSGFGSKVLRTKVLKDTHSVDEAKEWIRSKKKELPFEGVSVVEVPIPLSDGKVQPFYWVGNKGFGSMDEAQAEIVMAKSLIEAQGGDFQRAVQLAQEFVEPEAPPSIEIKTRAQFQKEEEIALKWADQLDIGEDLYGPFQGVAAGEKILYQSFGETTWRSTNLDERRFNSQVGFWSNRIVFKGIRFPINTIDPFVEVTAALESTGNDGGSQLDTSVGFEWRPLEKNAWLDNFRPWGIPLLVWAKNYRFFVQYFDRRNLKDEIANIRDFDFRAGISIFYEWGIDLPSVGQKPGRSFIDLLTYYAWGEYFGEYGWRDTNFTAEEDFDAFLLDTSLILGLKTPGIPLPSNPINDELVLMPYLRLALTQNTRLSNPSDNKYFIAVGLRWMPFRAYRFQNNEWLFKTKLFVEYLGIGKVQNLKQDDSRPLPDEDWRIGVAFSLRRF